MLECMDFSGCSPAFNFAAAKQMCKKIYEEHFRKFYGIQWSFQTQKVYRFPRHASNSSEPRPAIKVKIYLNLPGVCSKETTLYFYYDFLTSESYYKRANSQVVYTFWILLKQVVELRDIATEFT